MTLQLLEPASVTDEAIAHWLLTRDPLFGRLSAADAQCYAASALEHGRHRADIAGRRWGRDVCALAAALDVPVIECDTDAGFRSTIVFAEYNERLARITLYRAAIARINDKVRHRNLAASLGVGDCTPVFVAHEIYHHLERQDAAHSLARRCRVTLFRVGPWRWTGSLSSLDEIGAGAFAQALLGLPRHPGLLDLICVVDAQTAGPTLREAA